MITQRDITMEELVQKLALEEDKKRAMWREKLGFVFDRDYYQVAFNSDAYLRAFYEHLEEPAMHVIHMCMPLIAAKLPKGGRMCDFGAGPTIHIGVCFRHCVDENRDELTRWRKKESNFDWSIVLKNIACHEGTTESWTSMEEETRSKVRGVLYCNCLLNPSIELPTEIAEGFDIITTSYCTEYCTKTEEEYKSAIKNIVHHIKPGGYFIMCSILEQTWYSFGGRKFNCLYITEEFMLSALREAGLTVTHEKTISYYPMVGVVITCARKPFKSNE